MVVALGIIVLAATISSAAQSGAVLVPALVSAGFLVAGWFLRRWGQARTAGKGGVTLRVSEDRLVVERRSEATKAFDRAGIGLLLLDIRYTGGRLSAVTRIVVYDPTRAESANIATHWQTGLAFRLRYTLRRWGYPTAYSYVGVLGRESLRPSKRAPEWTRAVAGNG